MSQPTACDRARSAPCYCTSCDLLVGLAGFHVVDVGVRDVKHGDGLRVVVESPARVEGCRACGVLAHSHGRRLVRLVDAPCFARPVQLVWSKRTWRCAEPACAARSFTEQDPGLAGPRALLTTRACWWAINQIRRENTSVAGVARQLGTTWRTVWRAIKPLLEQMAADPARFDGVTDLGVDEHIWHYTSTRPEDAGGRGPKELTGMVNLTRDQAGRVRARLLDLVPGRSGKAYADWLNERGEEFRKGIKVATLDPFHGYKKAIDDQLDDAVAVLDAFHVVKLASTAADECRRRVQHETLGHRGRSGEPLYGIRNLVRAGAERLTERQWARFQTAIAANEEHHLQVYLAWHCAQQLRDAYRHPNLVQAAGSPSSSSTRCRLARSRRSPDSAAP